MKTSKAENQVLLYLIKNNKVLLIEKKRGLGAGLINGLGGKVNDNETIEEAVIRESKEEAGILPKNLQKKATLFFINNEKEHIITHVFIAHDYEGSLYETEEAKPFWQNLDSVPYKKMWEDDIYWLPYVLSGLYVYGEFKFKDWKMTDKKVYVSSEGLSALIQYLEDNARYCPFFKETNVKEYLKGVREEIEEILNAKNLEEFKEEIADTLHDFLAFIWKLDKEKIISKEELIKEMLKKMEIRKPHVFKKEKIELKEAVDFWFQAKHKNAKYNNIETKLRDETKKWLFKLKNAKIKPLSNKSKEILKNIQSYINDAEYFLKNNMLIEAFEAVIWAWSWAEIGERLEFLKLEKI